MSGFNAQEFELVEEAEFFAPTATDAISVLLAEHREKREQIEHLAGLMSGELSSVIRYFIEGNVEKDRSHFGIHVDSLFDAQGAVKALDAEYWSKTLERTDVLDCMPQARRTAWHQQLTAWKEPRYKEGQKPEEDLPPYNEDAVRPTIAALLSMRSQFLAERVDGIFRGLSGTHVTNTPEGFQTRCIIANALTYYGAAEHTKAGLINDLRAVIAKFMGRDEPHHGSTSRVIDSLRSRYGEWVTLDGGAIRIKLFKKGTAHLEVHPQMAYRLNQILASLYPMAIPSQFRTKPAKIPKEFQTLERPLAFAVLNHLQSCSSRRNENHVSFSYCEQKDRDTRAQAADVLRSIGGEETSPGYFQFSYCPVSVIAEILLSGVVPAQRSHQFYATPEVIGKAVADQAEIQNDDSILEPSAGQGDLAAHFAKAQTTCVELSRLHCAILKAKGYQTEQADFLVWAEAKARAGATWSKLVMNPPFADRRAELHVTAASKLVAPAGRLVAVLPASLKDKNVLPGWVHQWSHVYQDEFEGTGVSVVILTATKAAT